MPAFDLKSPDTRILECTQCDEPVSGVPSAGKLTVTCGYCGFEDVRELSTTRSTEASTPYRGKNKGKKKNARGLRVDLSQHLEDMPKAATLADLRAKFLEQKKALAAGLPEDERTDAEYRLVWIGATLAAHQIAGRDYLHARAVLEATLEVTVTPAYRALVLARLARLASLSNAPELGEKWLAACPTGLRVAEVDSDVRVAEALLARGRGDAKAVLEIIGERDTADEFVGGSRWLAVALRVDAHEKLGDRGLAARYWREASKKNALVLGSTAASYGLAVGTRKGLQRKALVVLPALGFMVWGVLAMFRSLVAETPLGVAPLIAFAAGSLIAIIAARI